MSECPVCHVVKRRLDLHMKAKHPNYKPKAPEPSRKLVKRLVRRVVKNGSATESTARERELAQMLTPEIEPIRLCDVQDPPEFFLNTPLTLQAAIESPQYDRHIRSLRFGKGAMLGKRWMIILIVGMVGLVLLLYFAGVLPTGR